MPSAADPVMALYAALERGDLDALDACLHPEVAWRTSPTIPWGHMIEGRSGVQAVREYLTMFGERLDVTVTVDDVIETNGRVVTLGVISGSARSTGAPLHCPFAHVWSVEEGRIVAHRGYPDTAAVVQALEAAS